VSPVVAALLGALVGLLAGGLLVVRLVRSRLPAPSEPTLLPADLRRVTESLRSAAVVVGPNDEILASSPAAPTLGVVRGSRIGIPALLALVRQARAGGEALTVNLDHRRSSGRPEVQLAVRVVPLAGRLTWIVADDRAPALRLEESSRDFLANATHELKTPIGAITLLAEAAEEAADDPAAVRRFARRIQNESGRLGRLVSQLIQLSRLQGHAMRVADLVEVDAVVAAALDRSRELAAARSISLTIGGTPGLRVLGDADQLQTAVTNLVHNAITYSDAKARVVVTTRAEASADGDRVAIAVSDNGIGIAPEDTARVFERFYRVDYARSRASGGTGLGLSIVEEIVTGHGGEVTVWSKPGSGSTFTIVLPSAPGEEEP